MAPSLRPCDIGGQNLHGVVPRVRSAATTTARRRAILDGHRRITDGGGGEMSRPDSRNRDFVLGQEMRVTILTRGEETEWRHDVVEAVQEPGTITPLHLHTRYDERLWVIDGEITVWPVTTRSGSVRAASPPSGATHPT
jgi:mannose-6-phosphate isomerase-like protein (cupin superfamily)